MTGKKENKQKDSATDNDDTGPTVEKPCFTGPGVTGKTEKVLNNLMGEVLSGLDALADFQKSWDGGMKELFRFLEKNNQEIFSTLERYRILAQLGELDAKVLAFSLNDFAVNPTLQGKMLKLRRRLLLEREVPLEELQKEFIAVFNLFADDVENMMESGKYPEEAKEIILNMREVCWM